MIAVRLRITTMGVVTAKSTSSLRGDDEFGTDAYSKDEFVPSEYSIVKFAISDEFIEKPSSLVDAMETMLMYEFDFFLRVGWSSQKSDMS